MASSSLSAENSYFTIDELLAAIDDPNGEDCRRLYAMYRRRFEMSPGSSHNHQAWPGGYIDHVVDAMNIGYKVYDLYNSLRPLPFSKSDVLLIVFLHDLEKPFRYTNEDGTLVETPVFLEKEQLEEFKRQLITQAGITLTPQQSNALEFVEGIRDHKYRKDARVMSELAVICHIADLTSARLWFNHPLAVGDPWPGAQRQHPAAAGFVLPSEWYPRTV
ncbi:MAG TPA: hypothetical protein VFT59_05030 [Candidatus Saccharimonadales bacterium]|nr:hypothetical protein [Candidatus Saccharimonadales bacterium]